MTEPVEAVELSDEEREKIADACDAGIQYDAAWIRFLRNGMEDMLLPVIESILADRLASARVQWEKETRADAIALRKGMLGNSQFADGYRTACNDFAARIGASA